MSYAKLVFLLFQMLPKYILNPRNSIRNWFKSGATGIEFGNLIFDRVKCLSARGLGMSTP